MYAVEFDPPAEKQRDTLPVEALPAFMEVRALLELALWSGDPPSSNPAGNMLSMPFGHSGIVTYVVMERRQLVYIVRIVWL
ncbi:hypothetical protein [Nonomuraea sp. NPDC049158]|uniref:hypothetical protein n=1 Tax=Nonomuraea sp. NPDC049158 TaxID=3155649 RepID=UPI003403592F